MRQSRLASLALASVSTLALSAGAQAQGTPPIYNWTGFYIGANAGGAWGRSDASTSVPCNNADVPPSYLCFALPTNDSRRVAASGSGTMSGTGFNGGVQAGYNWQTRYLVYGVEADFGALNVRTSRQATRRFATFNGNLFTINNSASTDWLFTARGRVGLAFSGLLAYATGGAAITDLQTSHSYADATGNDVSGRWSHSQVKLGWTVGGGVEWGVNRNWRVKAEYLYVKFGSINAAGQIGGPSPFSIAYAEAISTSADLTAHIARAGVNFRF